MQTLQASICLILDQSLWHMFFFHLHVNPIKSHVPYAHVHLPIHVPTMFEDMYIFYFPCQLFPNTCSYSRRINSFHFLDFSCWAHCFTTSFVGFLPVCYYVLLFSYCCHQSGHYNVYEDFCIKILLISKCEPEFQVSGTSKINDRYVIRNLNTYNSTYISRFRTINIIW